MIRLAAFASMLCLAVTDAAAHSTISVDVTKDLSFQQHLGAALPLDVEFRDASGRLVRLREIFQGKPIVLVMEYLRCKTLCGFVLDKAAQALARMPLAAARDYEVVAISIDPRDSPADALEARRKYAARLHEVDARGWHFLTGQEAAIHRVADSVGFPFRYDAAVDQYAHPAGLVVATPEGTVARYILGLDYRPLDLRLALTDAAAGGISSPATDLLLLCYCYDPQTGRYSFAISNITRALCVATVLAIGMLVVKLVREGGR